MKNSSLDIMNNTKQIQEAKESAGKSGSLFIMS